MRGVLGIISKIQVKDARLACGIRCEDDMLVLSYILLYIQEGFVRERKTSSVCE